ncbi:MAG: metallophosphoesterase [Clostridia bacterium]
MNTKKHTISTRMRIIAAAILCCCAVLITAIALLSSVAPPVNNNPPITNTSIEPAPIDAPYMIAWMSDTQYYAESYPEIFNSITDWIASNHTRLNIEYVVHTGDVVNSYDDSVQWANAKAALSVLDGKVPLHAVAGNHDIDNDHQRYDAYLELLGEDRFDSLATFGGSFDGGKGRYDLLDIDGEPVILLSVGYWVNTAEIEWLNQTLREYVDRTAILCFHSYIDTDESLTTDGKRLYTDVVAQNPNVKLVLCGHRHGVNHFAATFDDNGDGTPERTVYQLVADYQNEPNGGGGYLCLLSFDSSARQINVTSYSPYLDDYNYLDDNTGLEEFTLPWIFD